MRFVLPVLLVATVVDFASAQVTPQTALTPEQKAAIAALGPAKPDPMPFPSVGPLTPTGPGGLQSFNPATGRITQAASSNPLAPSPSEPVSATPGSPGRVPSGTTPLAVAREGVGGPYSSEPPRITATQPSALLYPYSFPFGTVFKLLMRFTANANNYYSLCSASSLSSHHLLTAGHCLYSHDIAGDGTNIAGFAAEVWAWPAQTDVVGPLGVPDFPYGVAKMTLETTYNAWINSSDLNWDFAWMDVDRRIGDNVGWMGREANVTTTALNFDGYPAEPAYGFGSNPFQYFGFDANNIQSYSSNRINLSAFIYGGHSGGPAWRYDGTNDWVEGVNSTSDRAGNASETRVTTNLLNDVANSIATDPAPSDAPYFIEYSLSSPGSSKGIVTPSVSTGGTATVTYNLFNAGFVASSPTVYFYLSTTPGVDVNSIYLGSIAFGAVNAFNYFVNNANLQIPNTTPARSYYVVWTWSSSVPEYPTHFVTYFWGGIPPIGIFDNEAVITDTLLAVTNPAPTIGSLSPSSATAGGAGFNLIVNGSGFNTSSQVRWGGSNRATTYLSSTQLQASISSADISTSGTVQVSVFNPLPGGGTSGNSPFTINPNPPSAVSVTPSSGAGHTQTFNALYTDPSGAADLYVVYLDFGTSVFAPGSCIVAYLKPNNMLYLINDASNGTVAGSIVPGGSGTLSNGQCTLSGAGGAVTVAGNNLTVPFNISFAGGFTGSKNVYGLAQSNSGATAGWQTLGTWTPQSGGPPSAVSVTPNSGTGLTQTFNALYSDPSGALDLNVMYLDFGTSVFAPNSCIVAYVRSSNLLFLANDASSATVPGSITPGGSGTLTNSQCTLSGAGGAVTVAGNNLTVPFKITFLGGFTGLKNIYGLAQNNGGANSGWPLLGTWTVPGGMPLGAVSVIPNSGSGLSQTFSAVYTDPSGASDLYVVYLDIGGSVFAPNSCIVAYLRSSNMLYLVNDASNATVPGSIVPGGSGTLSNSQCTLSGVGGPVTPAGNNLTVPFTITFAGGFAGTKNVYGLAQNNSGANGGWPLLGTWTPFIGGPPLGAVSVSPNSGTGLTQTFNALYRDPNGASDLYVVYLDFGASAFAPGSCIVAYLRSGNMLYLINDASNATVPGSIVPGGGGTLTNGQCTLSGAGGTVTAAGDNLTVPFNITFSGGFSGSKTIFGLAQNNANASGGWQTLGNWMP